MIELKIPGMLLSPETLKAIRSELWGYIDDVSKDFHLPDVRKQVWDLLPTLDDIDECLAELGN